MLLAAGVLVAAAVTALPSAASAGPAAGGSTQGGISAVGAAARPAPRTEPEPVLERSLNGQAAVTALAGELPEVAARNGKTPAELVALLHEDPSMWLSPDGRLLAKDVLPAQPATTTAATVEAGPYPDAETFRLHSKPGAPRVIHLDFDGHAVTGTIWNSQGLSTRLQPAFDLDDTPGRWTQAEHDVIQSAFRRVAEDFAPFDVDVTTQDPGAAALNRSSESDTRYGARVLITPSPEGRTTICGGGVAGCSNIGVFDLATNGYDQPAWVFTDGYSTAKYVAEVASHEAGHNLGLTHDTTSDGYAYGGHGNWAPIMGNGLWKPLVQWSNGDYPGAGNREDDVAVMARHGLALRADDHGSTTATATAVGAAVMASGIIRSRVDSDMFAFSRSCAGTATVTARPAPDSPDLDVRLRLRNAAGVLVAKNDPPSGLNPNTGAATGLAASVTAAVQPGTYYAEVDGVGVRTPADGYSDYGSRGQYTVEFSRCPLAPTPQLLLTPGELGGVAGGGWVTRSEDLTPRTTVEPLASCTGTATLSPSVLRTFAKPVPGPTVGQRVVRYQPGRADGVLDVFRGVLAQCPVRSTPDGVSERWTALGDTAGTTTDTLIIRRSPVDPARAPVSYHVVVREGDVVSVLRYAPRAGVTGDDAAARTLAKVTTNRLRTAG